MSELGDAIRAAQKKVDENLPPDVVSAGRYRWMDRREEDQVPNERALQFVQDVLTRKFKHERKGRFSPSSLGHCLRRQMFSYMGVEQLPASPELQEMADAGTYSHIAWQVAGLTEPYLLDVEVWVEEPGLRTGGSLDGLCLDSSIFELKSVTGFQYAKVIEAPVRLTWELQLAIYFLLADSAGIRHHDHASLVVTTRDIGKFNEQVIVRSHRVEEHAVRILTTLNKHVDEDTLPPMLEDCIYETGPVFKACPYKHVCPLYSAVSQTAPHKLAA
jgi:hypothetical protein